MSSVVESFITNSDEMIIVNWFYKSRKFLRPAGNSDRGARSSGHGVTFLRYTLLDTSDANLTQKAYPMVPAHLGSFASSQAMIVGSSTYRPTKALT